MRDFERGGAVAKAIAPFFGLLALVGVAACTVADSSIYLANRIETHCNSQLGQYVLPRSVVHIVINEVQQTDPRDSKPKTYNVIESLSQEQHPHNEMRYCFDYKANAASHDKVNVKTDNGLLSFVSSAAADQTAYIVKTLVRAVFVGISGNPNYRANEEVSGKVKVADLTFDPFDVHETAAKNARLVQLGFCLVLEGFTYRRGDTAQTYCNDPQKYLTRKTEYTTRYREILDTTIVGHSDGILYRPRVPYTLMVYTRHDADKAGGRWRPRQSEVMEFENISPFISVKLDRTMFAVKRIGLVFSAGELRNACVFKSSEAMEAVTIPLEIVKSVVALPTGIFQVRFDNVTGARELAEAENTVIRAQIAYLDFLNNGTATSSGGTRPSQPDAYTYGQTDKFTKLQISDSQLSFWDEICNAPASASAANGRKAM